MIVTVGIAAGGSALLGRMARNVEMSDRVRALAVARPRAAPGGWRASTRAHLDHALERADMPLDAGGAIQVWLLAALAAGCLAGGLDLVLAPAAVVTALIGGPILLYGARHRGARRCAAELPVALEVVAGELRTGGTVTGAVAALGRSSGQLASEFARIDRRCTLGAALDDALQAWAGERSDAGVSSAAGALAVAATTGGRSAEALDGLAASLRDRSEIAAEARALSAQARLSAVVVGSLPIGYLAVCAFIDPRQVQALTQTPFGLGCLAAGLTLEALAALWIRALLRQDA